MVAVAVPPGTEKTTLPSNWSAKTFRERCSPAVAVAWIGIVATPSALAVTMNGLSAVPLPGDVMVADVALLVSTFLGPIKFEGVSTKAPAETERATARK